MGSSIRLPETRRDPRLFDWRQRKERLEHATSHRAGPLHRTESPAPAQPTPYARLPEGRWFSSSHECQALHGRRVLLSAPKDRRREGWEKDEGKKKDTLSVL